tara:strand:+ start:172 stop:465 length:294 start_codon:yes stop_codon:yes gene_type:complete
MIKILLPLLMLFSMQSFAVMPVDTGFASHDYIVDSGAVLTNRCAIVRDKATDNERMYNVTGAATQNLELKTTSYKRGYVLSMRSLPLEVGWRSTEII